MTVEYLENGQDTNTYINSVMNEIKPYEFTTGNENDDTGEITVNGLKPGWYQIIEVGSELYEYSQEGYPSAYVWVSDDTSNQSNVIIYVPNNKKVSTSVSGYVWEDLAESKGYVKDHMYNVGTESGMDGITVKLKDAFTNEVISQTKTSELGIYNNIRGGEYIFYDVPIECLSYYYVEFVYNGIIYQASDIGGIDSDVTINSKAMEGDEQGSYRKMFDSCFDNGIVNNGYNSVKVKDYNIVIGYTGTGTIKQIDKNNMVNCDVVARTQVSGWDEDTRYSLLNLWGLYGDEVMYVNLGIYEKPQADLRVAKDLEDVTIEFEEDQDQKYSQVYKYHEPKENEPNPVNGWNADSFQTQSKYQRNIYKSDIEYNNGQNISLYATYKIALINEGPYNAIINNILEYYSSDFDIVDAWTEDGNEVLDCGDETLVNDSYKKCIIQTNKIQLSAEYGKCLYVRFKVNENGINKLLNDENITEYNTIEINSYTVYKDNFINSVAAVDKDSIPGNAILGDISTYEDDTAVAPPLDIKPKERKIQGTVFEDKATKSSGIGNVREGDGIFDEETESGIANVWVTLRNIATGKEYKDDTDENGNYEIKGFIPGQYKIIYTWGDNEYPVQTYKGTIYDINRDQSDIYWYKDDIDIRKTDAIDDYQERIDIDAQMSEITDRSIYTVINQAYQEGYTGQIINSMNSVTPTMQFDMEYNDNQVDEYIVKNIDFGIIERSKQILDVEKRVTNFKITLANGQELVNATVLEDGTLQGLHTDVTYMGPNKESNFKGWIKAEIDNELIEGAKAEIIYEIKYVNNSELDYMTEDFYIYGSVVNPDPSNLVTLTPYGVVDYLDKKLGFEANKNEIWTEINKETVAKWYTEENKSPEEIKTENLLYAKEQLSALKPVEPGKQDRINLNVSKLLAVSDDLTFSNKVDTVQITKPEISDQHTGSIIEYFPNADAEDVMITPNTGDNKAYVLPVITGIVSLIILGVGIFMIKKKVIDS